MHVAPLGHLDCFRRRSQNFVRLSFRSRETVRRATEEMGIMWWEQLGLIEYPNAVFGSCKVGDGGVRCSGRLEEDDMGMS